MVNGRTSSRKPTTLKFLSINTRSNENSIPIVCTAFDGTIQTPLSCGRDLRPRSPTSRPSTESATATRKARKVSLVLLYTKTCRCLLNIPALSRVLIRLKLARRFFLHSVNQGKKYDYCQHPRYDANYCYVIHLPPLVRVN